MSTTLISPAGDATTAPEPDGSAAAAQARRGWATWALQLVGRGVLDCAYLVRTPLSRRRKLRIVLEYVRLTIKLLMGADPPGARSERVMGYRVGHFGSGSLQFLFREIFVRSEYFFRAGDERPLVLDCGANIGLATLFFKWLSPRCEVHANVERNALDNVYLHNVALCDRNEAIEFFVPQGGPGSLMMSLVPGRVPEAESRAIVVEGRTLSPYVEGRDIDFLKMDIEGGERAVLGELAAAGVLPRIREMVVEYHHNLQGSADGLAGFLALLQGSGYQYQVDATRGASDLSAEFQDILVWARRPHATSA
jgi:FkbM family methyltransferase